jgi:two-component system, cell cycle response regulator
VWSHEEVENPYNPAVLAVVDDAATERAIADCLDCCRLEVDFVARLERAVEALRRRAYDVLLIDLALPGQADRSLLFRAQMLAPRIPVVLLTANPDEGQGQQALEAGVQDYVVTDGEVPADLARRLRHAVIRHGQLRRSRQSASWSAQDPVTGLAGRGAFQRKLEDVLAFAARLRDRPALLQVHLGNLGEVRQRLGPATAVRMIREIGRRLTWCVRRTDSLGRLGEEDFAILLSRAATATGIRMVAERVRLTASTPYDSDGESVRLSASVGAAWFPLDGDTPGALLQAAQAALEETQALGDGHCQLFRGYDLPAWPADILNGFRMSEPAWQETGRGNSLTGAPT